VERKLEARVWREDFVTDIVGMVKMGLISEGEFERGQLYEDMCHRKRIVLVGVLFAKVRLTPCYVLEIRQSHSYRLLGFQCSVGVGGTIEYNT
jgi:hypothetical protein